MIAHGLPSIIFQPKKYLFNKSGQKPSRSHAPASPRAHDLYRLPRLIEKTPKKDLKSRISILYRFCCYCRLNSISLF